MLIHWSNPMPAPAENFSFLKRHDGQRKNIQTVKQVYADIVARNMKSVSIPDR